jgi:hypothetical protein
VDIAEHGCLSNNLGEFRSSGRWNLRTWEFDLGATLLRGFRGNLMELLGLIMVFKEEAFEGCLVFG